MSQYDEIDSLAVQTVEKLYTLLWKTPQEVRRTPGLNGAQRPAFILTQVTQFKSVMH